MDTQTPTPVQFPIYSVAPAAAGLVVDANGWYNDPAGRVCVVLEDGDSYLAVHAHTWTVRLENAPAAVLAATIAAALA